MSLQTLWINSSSNWRIRLKKKKKLCCNYTLTKKKKAELSFLGKLIFCFHHVLFSGSELYRQLNSNSRASLKLSSMHNYKTSTVNKWNQNMTSPVLQRFAPTYSEYSTRFCSSRQILEKARLTKTSFHCSLTLLTDSLTSFTNRV